MFIINHLIDYLIVLNQFLFITYNFNAAHD